MKPISRRANLGQAIVAHLGHIDVAQHVAASRRPIETAKQIEQRALARTARPHDRDVVALGHIERNAAQSVHGLSAEHVILAQIADADGQPHWAAPAVVDFVEAVVCLSRSVRASPARHHPAFDACLHRRLPFRPAPSRPGAAGRCHSPAAPLPSRHSAWRCSPPSRADGACGTARCISSGGSFGRLTSARYARGFIAT